MTFRAIRIDPLDKASGMLVPFVVQRMLSMARESQAEYSGDKVVRDYLSRLFTGDPTVMLIAVVNDKGVPMGHVAASLMSDGDLRDATVNRWVFVSQTKMDDNVGDVRVEVMAMLDTWGQSFGAKELMMVTGKNEKPWEKRYGFKTTRRVCARPLGYIPQDTKED